MIGTIGINRGASAFHAWIRSVHPHGWRFRCASRRPGGPERLKSRCWRLALTGLLFVDDADLDLAPASVIDQAFQNSAEIVEIHIVDAFDPLRAAMQLHNVCISATIIARISHTRFWNVRPGYGYA